MSAPAKSPEPKPELQAEIIEATPAKRKPTPFIVGALLLAVVGYGGYSWMQGRNFEGTDDAYVTADIVQVASEVKGSVTQIRVQDNALVKAGDEIATLEPSEYDAALAQAEANLAMARARQDAAQADTDLTRKEGLAGIENARGGAGAAAGGLGAAQAQVSALRAQLANAQEGVSIARSDAQSVNQDVNAAQQAVDRAQSQVGAAVAAVDAAKASAQASQAGIDSATANRSYAQKQFARSKDLFTQGVISQRDLDQATLALDAANAAVDQAQRQKSSAEAAVQQRQSELLGARAAAQSSITALSQTRIRNAESRNRIRIAQTQVASQVSNVQAAQQAVVTAQGSFTQARAGIATAQTLPQKLKTKEAQSELASAEVKQAEAALANARLNLKRTHVLAPISGTVSKRYAQQGTLLQLGSPVVSIVPQQDLYVVANFKETQVGRMHPGEKVEVEVDGFPGNPFEGVVDSLSAATGSQFALIPPDNATGNFVKVVQRVPVKIRLKAESRTPQLAAGMSASAKVRVVQ